MFKNKKIILIALTIFALMLSACNNSADNGEENTESKESESEDVIVLGTSADYPPFEFMDKEKNIIGFDIMVAEEIAKDMGKKLEIKNMQYDSLLMALETGDVDMILAGMNPDDKRREKVDFSELYHLSKHYVVINSKDKDIINSEENLSGKKVGVQLGTTQEKIAREKLSDSEIISIGKIPDLMLQLQSGKIDAVITEDAVAESYVGEDDKLILSGIEYEGGEDGGIAVAIKKAESGNEASVKSNKEILESINKTINRLREENKLEEFFKKAEQLSKSSEES